MVYSGNNLVGARGFEPRLPDGELCFTGRRGQPYPPDTQKIIEPRTTLPLCALKLQTAHNAIAVRSKLAEGGGIEPHGFSPVHRFRGGSATIHRRPLCIQIWCPRRDLHSHSRNGNWFLRPARLLFRHPGIGAPIRTRTGFQRICSPPPRPLRHSVLEQQQNFGWGGRTRTFDRSGQSRVQLPLCHSPTFWLRGPVSSRPLCGFRAALSPD